MRLVGLASTMQIPPRKPRLLLHTLCASFLITLLPQQAAALCAPHHQHHHDWSGQVRYWHLQRMNASCYPRDSCRDARRPRDGLHVSRCLCSRACALFDACCVDSPHRFYRPPMKVSHNCVRFPSRSFSNHAFMVDRCRPGWTGDSSVTSLCNGDAQETGDPLLLVPVTHRRTGITYRNCFCAACNDESDLAQNVFWHLKLASSKEIAESSVSEIRFDPEISSWVIPNEDTLVKISLQVEPPEEIAGHVTTCQSDVISDCDPSWPEDDPTRRKCASYMAIVEVNDDTPGPLRFRNVHCALCNGYRGVTCIKPLKLAPRRPLSFALLLDVNLSDGETVGEIQRCREGALWDPFFKKCRVLVCGLPGHIIRDGRCVRV